MLIKTTTKVFGPHSPGVARYLFFLFFLFYYYIILYLIIFDQLRTYFLQTPASSAHASLRQMRCWSSSKKIKIKIKKSNKSEENPENRKKVLTSGPWPSLPSAVRIGREVTDGCPGRRTRGISRLSAATCCAIPWPELRRLTPGMSAPLLQSRAPPDQARSRPSRAAQFAPRPRPPLASRLGLCIKAVRSASYGPTQPKRGVVGCRLWLPAPFRARGKTPSGQVSRSREVYGC